LSHCKTLPVIVLSFILEARPGGIYFSGDEDYNHPSFVLYVYLFSSFLTPLPTLLSISILQALIMPSSSTVGSPTSSVASASSTAIDLTDTPTSPPSHSAGVISVHRKIWEADHVIMYMVEEKEG